MGLPQCAFPDSTGNGEHLEEIDYTGKTALNTLTGVFRSYERGSKKTTVLNHG